MNFKELGINDNTIEKLNKMGITSPTPIQEESIDIIKSGKDLIAEAQTGTGKTLAFLLPIFENLSSDDNNIQALIISPTRELAIQITKEAEKLSENTEINLLAMYGGKDIGGQLKS
ncbi:DEAD/DEAH box helicase family protein [[Clostridium] sordellii ATCC 9714]|nr:DEAD/DEAH box helicase family protein [[Clostridium] sordellii ATCC 9714] [Paeniclostridium sordellii ATCC 9714]